jgi:hypothetical protein
MPKDAFRLLRAIAFLAWSLGLAGLGAWVYAFSVEHHSFEPHADRVLSGYVKNGSEKTLPGLPGVLVEASQTKEHDLSTSNGSFRIVLKESSSPIRVHATKSGYLPWEGWVAVPQSEYVIKLLHDPNWKRPPDTPTPKLYNESDSGSNTPSAPNWDQIYADLKRDYVVENVASIARTGKLEFAQELMGVADKTSPNWRLEPLSRDGIYCRQFASVTLQLADGTRRCSEVAAVYKLVAKKWRFVKIVPSNEACSN